MLTQDCPFALLRVVLGYFPSLPTGGAATCSLQPNYSRNSPRRVKMLRMTAARVGHTFPIPYSLIPDP
jgi:hypothetical protein